MKISIEIEPIGIIHSPITTPKEAPIQPGGAENLEGEIVIYEQFAKGLQDLEGFSHIYLLYHFHLATRTELVVTPFMDTSERGVFATRSPLRPNHIGISIVKLQSVDENIIRIKGVDIVNNTPLLDIKPYILAFDGVKNSRSGWMRAGSQEVASKRSDDRFL